MDTLTPKQALFVKEYLVDANGTRAATRAGYSPSSAAAQASTLLKLPKVAQALAAEQAARSERTEITADRVLTELARLAFADPAKCYDSKGQLLSVVDMPPEARAALAGMDVEEDGEGRVTRKVKTWSKVQSLELLGKHLGILHDKVEVTGKGGAPLSITIDLGAGK